MSGSDPNELSDQAVAELELFLTDWCTRHQIDWYLLCGTLAAKLIRIECEQTGRSGPEVMRRISDRMMKRCEVELETN